MPDFPVSILWTAYLVLTLPVYGLHHVTRWIKTITVVMDGHKLFQLLLLRCMTSKMNPITFFTPLQWCRKHGILIFKLAILVHWGKVK